MQQFQPPGFGQRAIATTLGVMAYYTVTEPWLPLPPDALNLVFLHSLGGGSSAYEWSKIYPAFAGSDRIFAPDLVGWGQSAHPNRKYAIPDYLNTLTEFIEHTHAKPAVVCASSLTAGIVIRLAIQQPDLVRCLILVCPSGYGDFGMDYAQGMSAQLARIAGLDRQLYNLGATNRFVIRQVLQQLLFACPERVTDEMVAAYLASAQQPNAHHAALSSLRGDLCFDLSLYISQLRVPTVLLWGQHARLSRVEVGKRLAGLNPDGVKPLYVIPETGTLPHLEAPEQVIQIMQPYLNSLRCPVC